MSRERERVQMMYNNVWCDYIFFFKKKAAFDISVFLIDFEICLIGRYFFVFFLKKTFFF